MRWILVVLIVSLAFPVYALDKNAVSELSAVLMKGPAEGNWQIKAEELNKWITEKKTDFVVVDVRPTPPGQKGGKIAGSLYIPYGDILKPENLAKLPKDKKVVLICVTGQTQNLPVLVLRAMGYNARTVSFGMSSWAKGYFGGKLMQDAIAGANYPVVE